MKYHNKIIVSFSGGKDSLASLIWAIKTYGVENVIAVFCDTGWEHELTYKHIHEVCEKLNVKLIILKSKKYKDFVDLAKQKKRFPSTKARFCTEELKTKPMIDFIIDECTGYCTIIQGIRKDESVSRSKMQKDCTYFKFYFQPYGVDKKGKKKFHTYRKKDIIKWRSENIDNVTRPIFDWTAQETIDYIIQNNMKPNPLYYMGMARVGCMPCIMCRHQEVKSMVEFLPESVERLVSAEKEVERSFFPPGYIPKKYNSGFDIKSGKSFPKVQDVLKYLKETDIDMFKDTNSEHSCMSYYGICE